MRCRHSKTCQTGKAVVGGMLALGGAATVATASQAVEVASPAVVEASPVAGAALGASPVGGEAMESSQVAAVLVVEPGAGEDSAAVAGVALAEEAISGVDASVTVCSSCILRVACRLRAFVETEVELRASAVLSVSLSHLCVWGSL
jgi:CRISPR/Cas system-associated exonuclease Cas4 (RecB family)